MTWVRVWCREDLMKMSRSGHDLNSRFPLFLLKKKKKATRRYCHMQVFKKKRKHELHFTMVFKHPPMSNDVACGSDHAYPVTFDRSAGCDEQSWNTVAVETSRVDLCFSNEVWSYQTDLEFLERQAEAQRRKAWNHRQNLKHRKWPMFQEDTNTWANIPSDSSFGPSRSRSLRQHVLQIAIQCEEQHRQDLEALDVSLPRRQLKCSSIDPNLRCQKQRLQKPRP